MPNNLKIIHEEPGFLVVEKPGGLLAVPGRGPDKQDCLVHRVKEAYPDGLDQPAVHRLDMATSGLMILARTRHDFVHLNRQFENRDVEKEYVAILEGVVKGNSGTIELSFRLDPDHRPHQIFDPAHGKKGITRWEKISITGQRTRVRFFPLTGRTHQLRLHASHAAGLGVPIVGDSLYGNGRQGDPMLLHAHRVSFLHPDTGQRVQFSSPVPF